MLSSLRVLWITDNRLDGNVSESIGSLSLLEELSVEGNSLQGVMSEAHFSILSKLRIQSPTGFLNLSTSNLVFLNLSRNNMRGPNSAICRIADRQLISLDLSNNLLSGKLPNCSFPFNGLIILSLANNNISGRVPRSLGSLSMLQTLSLRNNSFSGELPLSLKNCSALVFLDLSGNKLHGKIPAWMGESLLSLKFLSLESNEFNGSIPSHFCQLSNIQILDISLNNISGIIPKCLNNYTAMIQKGELTDMISGTVGWSHQADYVNKAWAEWKGRHYEYKRTQLQGLNASAFSGNLALCGLPVTQKCPGDETTPRPPAKDDGNEAVVDEEVSKWFYAAMGIGFGVFFWGVSASLLLKRSWRHAYFRILDEAWDRIYVKIAVQEASLQQR
ncbi:hypothetical protein OIU76_022982 [Salix suchowensis]|nr:hypothetical protein OIU76_022982 [Salix suchowensis]